MLTCISEVLLNSLQVLQSTSYKHIDFQKPSGTLQKHLVLFLRCLRSQQNCFQSQVPLIAEVLPMLDSIEQSMNLVCDDEESKLPNVVCVAAQTVLILINKYYTLMKETELYVIAIVMCPDKKLKWFKDHGHTAAQI
ncbi:hypothetical protein L208DRAFT_1550786, partial [Tricholoma matsutake]